MNPLAVDIAIAPTYDGAIAMRFAMIDYDTPRFKSSEVARAAGIEINSFRSYFKRGQFSMLGETEQVRQSHGYAHLFSLRDAMGYAIAGELIRVGVDATVSFKAGMWGFAHSSGVEFHPPMEGLPPVRDLGRVWDERAVGSTIMAVFAATGGYRLFPAQGQMNVDDAFIDPETHSRASAVLICVNDIERRVYEALGIAADDDGRDD